MESEVYEVTLDNIWLCKSNIKFLKIFLKGKTTEYLVLSLGKLHLRHWSFVKQNLSSEKKCYYIIQASLSASLYIHKDFYPSAFKYPQFIRGFQSPPPLFKVPTLDPACLSFLKSLFSLRSFLTHLLLKCFRQFSSPSQNPLLPQFRQSTFIGLNKYQNGDFNSSTVAFYQKSIFNLLIAFTNRLT